MLRFHLTIFLVTGLSFIAIPQNQGRPGSGAAGMPGGTGSVHGHILDKSTGEPIEYANIVLFRIKDSTMASGGVTDQKGRFTLEKVPFGMYYAKVSFIGYSLSNIPDIKVFPRQPDIDLGNIEITPETAKLNEVTISGQRQLMEFQLDKKVVNVEKSLDAVGGSAIDILKNIPSITVDIDNNLSMRGSSNVTLLIDGRPSSLTGLNLEQIPASSIETVELITNPSVRYNPEGMSGIINIKLRKKRETGFNGMVSANAGTGDKYNGSVNLNYNVGKFNFFGAFDARSDNRKGWNKMDRLTYINDTSFTTEDGESSRMRQSSGIKMGIDYSPDPLNSLTLSWYTNSGIHKDKSWTDALTDVNVDSLDSYFTQREKGAEDSKSEDYTFSYRRAFEGKGHEFTMDAVYSRSDDDEDETTYYENFHVNNLPVKDTLGNMTSTVGGRNNVNIQANYVRPFGKEGRLEGGYQGIIRTTDEDYHFYRFDFESNAYFDDTSQSNRFLYREDIHAIYGIFGQSFEKFSFQAGLRFEFAKTRSEQKTQDKTFDKDYTSYYPSGHVNYKLPLEQQLQLSYSRRVHRPNMWWLNPFVDYSHPGVKRYGNPDLNPEYINSYEFAYIKYWKKSSLNASLFYRKINDVINRYTFIDSTGYLNYTSKNINSGISYGTEVILDYEILKWWRLNLNFSYFKSEMNDEGGKSNSDYSWTSRFNSTFNLPKKFTIQFSGSYRGPMITTQGKTGEMFSTDLALRKDFFGDKLSASLRFSDLFNTSKFSVHSEDVGFINNFERRRESRVIYAGLTWKFGQAMKQKQRKRTNGDNNGRDFEEGEF